MPDKCPICNSALMTESTGTDPVEFHCTRCGPFSATKESLTDADTWEKTKDHRALVSHMIAKMGWRKRPPLLTRDIIQNIIRNGKLPSLLEQADNLIAYLALHDPGHEEELDLHHEAIMGAKDETGAEFIVDYLNELRYIDLKGDAAAGWLKLTMKGWERADQLRRGAVNSRRAFMAMQFGEDVLDAVYQDFKAAVEETGFNLFKLDEKPRAGLIDDRLRVEILGSRFLIADLTHGNQGAYWEAGYAEGLGKPVIYTCEKKKFHDKTGGGTHFDTNHHLTVLWEPEDIQRACNELKATIRATLPGEAKLEDAAASEAMNSHSPLTVK